MKTIYGHTPTDAILKQKQYFYGSIIGLLYFKEENYPLLDQRIQTIINQIHGSMPLFDNDARILSIIAWLENARTCPEQFRKNVLDAANMVDELGGDSNV
jgi:hypothetical protein